jgi:regulator of sirC expression with transglutaminase-like and TPR domain
LNVWLRTIVLSLTLTAPALAETLVDPTTVAPEYRDAAEKRRAEQIKQRECAKKADLQKVMPRERTAFLLQCLQADAQK